MAVTLHTQTGEDLDTIEDSESFTTVLKWGTQLLCYEPEREPYEFVTLSIGQVEIDSENKQDLGHDAKIYGDRSAWDETPLSHLSD